MDIRSVGLSSILGRLAKSAVFCIKALEILPTSRKTSTDKAEALVKRTYIKPEIVKIDLEDKQLLSMASNCKAELPEVSNCCFVGTDPNCTMGGGGFNASLGGTPNFDIGS